MKKFWVKVIAVFMGIALTNLFPTSMSLSAQRDIVDEGFIPAGTQGVLGRQGVKMMERPDWVETASVLRGFPSASSGAWKSCSSLSDSNCSTAQRIDFGAILQPCTTPTSLDCVAGFGVVTADGTRIDAIFERKFPAEAANKYPADSGAGLPEGGPGALWTVPTSA